MFPRRPSRMPAPANSQPPRKRAPNGVLSRTPVALRLLEEEKSELEALAAKESRSTAALARLLYLRGLQAYRADQKVLPE